jgi:branched-chain amino acid transport system ATP-binding protein
LNTSLSKKEEEQFMEDALETLRFLGIEDLKNEIAKNLPYGHQRVMSLGMALILKPKLLMLDEPVSGMNPQETKNMMDRIRETRDKKGVTVFLVEHNMKAVMGISDQISVLNFGKKIAEGTPQEIKANPAVIEAYLGVEDYVA